MTWGNPPAFVPTKPKPGKLITPEMLAASGSEDGHQAAVFAWAALNVGRYPQLKFMFSIPNGGSRHIAEATKMVGTGTRSGVPDIFLPAPIVIKRDIGKWGLDYITYHGCFIEMKIEKRRKQKDEGISDDQLDWLQYLASAGYYCKVCYGWEEARDTLIAYLEGRV